MLTQSYTLSLQPGGMPPKIPCVQGDANSRTLSFTLISGGAAFTPPSGAVATFDGTKPDGKSFSVSAAISGSTVTVTLTAQMTVLPGEIPCQITITGGEKTIGTAEILLEVAPSAIPANPDLSETELSAFAEMKTAAAQSASAAASSAAVAAQSASDAQTAAGGKADLAVPGSAGNLAALTAQGNLADSGLKITAGTWNPTVDGASAYTLQTGSYVQIGSMAIVSFAVYGTFSGSTTSRVAVTGCPLTPADGQHSGGGNLSGYTAAANITFCGWQTHSSGKFYAVGQETGTTGTNKWSSVAIYQKASGDFSAGGTIAFRVS